MVFIVTTFFISFENDRKHNLYRYIYDNKPDCKIAMFNRDKRMRNINNILVTKHVSRHLSLYVDTVKFRYKGHSNLRQPLLLRPFDIKTTLAITEMQSSVQMGLIWHILMYGSWFH